MNTPERPPGDETPTVSKLSNFVAERPVNRTTADETITTVVRHAVEEVCQSAPNVVIAPKDAPIAPKGLLGILAYCYAKRVYGSEEIERKLGENAAVVAACQNHVPDASFLRRFRRLNRVILQACLEKALSRSRRGSAMAASCKPETDGNTTVIHREAEERLDKAAFVDGMSQND